MNVSSHICKNPFSEISHQMFHFFLRSPPNRSVQFSSELKLFYSLDELNTKIISVNIHINWITFIKCFAPREKKQPQHPDEKSSKIINYFKVSFIHLFIHYIFLFFRKKSSPFKILQWMLTWIYEENMLVNNQEDVVPNCWMERLWVELS